MRKLAGNTQLECVYYFQSLVLEIMFYGQFILAKKGPLAKIWLAAHLERKLSRQIVFETDVGSVVNEVIRPKVCLAF